MSNLNLHIAKQFKNDEFYTQYQDIEKELSYYIEYNPELFRDKNIESFNSINPYDIKSQNESLE